MSADAPDVLCLSHVRWADLPSPAVRLLVQTAERRRVFLVEPPRRIGGSPHLDLADHRGVTVVTPSVPLGLSARGVDEVVRGLVAGLVAGERVEAPELWLSDATAIALVDGIDASGVVLEPFGGARERHARDLDEDGDDDPGGDGPPRPVGPGRSAGRRRPMPAGHPLSGTIVIARPSG